MIVRWTSIAKRDYHKNIDFLLSDWNIIVAKNFIIRIDYCISIIQKNPAAFKRIGVLEIRVVPATKHISIFYRVKNDEIIILRSWNNFKNPEKVWF